MQFINIGDCIYTELCKGAKIRNRYNQVPQLTQDIYGKVTNSQYDTTNESKEVSPFPAGDHKAHINRRTQRHSNHKTEKKHKRPTKEVPPGTVSKIFHWRALTGPTSRHPHPYLRYGSRHIDIQPAQKIPNPSTHHPPEHTNQETARR